ncbi:MAG: hypothetical protein RSA27_03015 [Oscillospiraceae bacterium]
MSCTDIGAYSVESVVEYCIDRILFCVAPRPLFNGDLTPQKNL